MSTISVLIIGCVNKNDIDELKKLLEDNRCTLEIIVDILKRFNRCNFDFKQCREELRKMIYEKKLEFEQEELFKQSNLKMEQEEYKEIEGHLGILGITPDEIKGLCKDKLLKLIKEKHKKLRLTWHPDKGGNKEKFNHIEGAWKEIEKFFNKNVDKHILKF